MYRFAKKKPIPPVPQPLLIEALNPEAHEVYAANRYSYGPFMYSVKDGKYSIIPDLDANEVRMLRIAVMQARESVKAELYPKLEDLIQPLEKTASMFLNSDRNAELSRLAAFEAIGIPVLYALSLDTQVSEFYIDSPESAIYGDHIRYGRFETDIVLSDRERKAIEVHMDTFKGLTADYANPSVKNEFEIFGNKLRVSLDLPPISASGFSLDVRKMTSVPWTLQDSVFMDMVPQEQADFLTDSLQEGRNVTIIGIVDSGKSTLLNALDESLDKRYRRVYVEDSVETKDLLAKGYHQAKFKVDSFDRSESRTKSIEITKTLHRSPDLVILGEIQSEEHSRAFFHALSAGITGLQTFHASSIEQALLRWKEMHGISDANLRDLDVLVLMERPERLGSKRQVKSIKVMRDGVLESVYERAELRLTV